MYQDLIQLVLGSLAVLIPAGLLADMWLRHPYQHTDRADLPDVLTHITLIDHHGLICQPGGTIELLANDQVREGIMRPWGRSRLTVAVFAWSRTPTRYRAWLSLTGRRGQVVAYQIRTADLPESTRVLTRRDGAVAIVGGYTGPARFSCWDRYQHWQLAQTETSPKVQRASGAGIG